ncbi:MAG: methionine--tRNA ligase, partial [Fibrobacteria bacterium]
RSMTKPKTFYVTTPIYYVNDAPHIGHSYSTILADVLTRFHKLAGDETFFLTGTDEHGQKVQQAADKRGTTPKEHCDAYSLRFKEAWKEINIGFDKFIRTTDPEHIAFVRKMVQALWDKGQIYEKEYEGLYSVGEERFFSEKELVNGMDPISGRPVERVTEKNYFFRMSAYQDWLIRYIEENPDFILPDFRRNEVLGFLRQPLNDLCISRPKSRLSWGITLPFDNDFVAYVWVDALFNYMSAVDGKTFSDGSPVWPADYHLLGKDILTTHAVYWTTMLKALDLPLPRHLLAHGWWMIDNARMSKTTGNVVDPMDMKTEFGVDVFRYFLMREMVVGQDASFSRDALILRLNSELANDVGNGLSRILKLAATGLESKLAPAASEGEEEIALQKAANVAVTSALDKVHALKLSLAIEDTLVLIRAVNRYLEMKAPWKLAKEGEAGKAKLNSVLYHSAEALRIGFSLLHPVMPTKMEEALAALGLAIRPAGFETKTSPLVWGGYTFANPLAQGVNLFPRFGVTGSLNATLNSDTLSGKGSVGRPTAPAEPFSQVHLKVAQVESVEEHPNADSLYVLRLKIGEEERTVCAGLKKHLTPEEMRGRKVVVVYNLKPANLRGVESKGMILAAEDPQGKVIPVDPEGASSGDDVTAEGITAAYKADLTMKEFEKAPLSVQSGAVRYKDHPLKSPKGLVKAQAIDGTQVR